MEYDEENRTGIAALPDVYIFDRFQTVDGYHLMRGGYVSELREFVYELSKRAGLLTKRFPILSIAVYRKYF